MPKIQVYELPGFSANIALKNAEKQYKNYCTIRRDLRDIDTICNYVIQLQESIKTDKDKFHEFADTLFLVRAAIMHAIVLYSRWFKATSGKTKLSSNDFFASNSEKILVHNKVVELRDSYIAHNELDLLGADRVWVNTDDSGKFVSSENDWQEETLLQGKELNMKTFRECVHIVHNKLDAEIIPKKQKGLDEKLKKELG